MADRNVKVTVEIEMCLPDVTHQEIEAKWANDPGYVAHAQRQPSDESHELVVGIVHDIIEAGDPDDAYDMVVVVSDIKLKVLDA